MYSPFFFLYAIFGEYVLLRILRRRDIACGRSFFVAVTVLLFEMLVADGLFLRSLYTLYPLLALLFAVLGVNFVLNHLVLKLSLKQSIVGSIVITIAVGVAPIVPILLFLLVLSMLPPIYQHIAL